MTTLPALNCLQNEDEMKVHFFSPYANWLIPNVVMMGEHPAINRNFARGRIQGLCKKGRCRTFVCLQSEVPPQTCKASLMGGFQDWEKNTSSKMLPSYYYHVANALPDEKPLYIHYGMRSNGQVDSLNSYDMFMNELKCRIDLGEVLYIHCNGDNTRTNIVAAGLLQRLYSEISMKEAMQRTQKYYEMRNRTSNNVPLHSIMSGSIYQKEGILGSMREESKEEKSKENDKIHQKEDSRVTIRLPPWSKLSGEEEERKSELSISLGIRDVVHQKRLFYEKYIRIYSPGINNTLSMSSTPTETAAITEPLHNMEHNRIKQIKNKLRYIERWPLSVVSGPEDIPAIEVDCQPILRSLWSVPLREESEGEEAKEDYLNNEYFSCKISQKEDKLTTKRLPQCSISSIENVKGQHELASSLGTRDKVHQKRLFYKKYLRPSSLMIVITTSSIISTPNDISKPLHNIEHNRIKQIKNKLRYIERWPFSVVSGPGDIPREESREESKEDDLNNEYSPCKLSRVEDNVTTIRQPLCFISPVKEVKEQHELAPSLEIRNTVHQKRIFYEKFLRSSFSMKVNTSALMKSAKSTLAEQLHNLEHIRIKEIKNKLRFLEATHTKIRSKVVMLGA